MGQYHIPCSLTKREYINPHDLGDGLKLMEMAGSGAGGVGSALIVLLGVSNGRGGGDLHDDPHGIAGRWGAGRVVIIGDYAENTDYVALPGEPQPEDLYHLLDEPNSECTGKECEAQHFKDITPLVKETLSPDIGVLYVGDGWQTRYSIWDLDIPGFDHTHLMGPGRVASIGRKNYLVKDLEAALAKTLAKPGSKPADIEWPALISSLSEVTRG